MTVLDLIPIFAAVLFVLSLRVLLDAINMPWYRERLTKTKRRHL